MSIRVFGVGRRGVAAAAAGLLTACLANSAAAETTVRFATTLGNVDVTLYDSATPVTVANFLNYQSTGRYDDTFLHRSVPGFVVQGGGFYYDPVPGELFRPVSSDPQIVNEFGVSNTRGTIAMAKLGGNPDSATNQWFFNLDDNNDPSDPNNLDDQNGGFTVFGRVVGNGMAVVDAIAALNRYFFSSQSTAYSSAMQSVPLTGVNGDPLEDRFVFVESMTVLNVLSGDFNGNGAVEQGDLDLVLSNWGATASQTAVGLYGHGPGQVGQSSLDAVLQHWGTSAAPDFSGSAVPEPGAAVLAVLGLLVGHRRR